MTRSDVWKQRPVVERYHAYCDELRLRLTGWELPEDLDIVFCLPMPQSWSQKKKSEMVGKPHQQKPDIDNLLKGFMDAMATEDSYVWKVTAEKRWRTEGAVWVD